MNILHITTTDPAGAVYNFVRALNTFTKHRARLITTVPNPGFEFPKDVQDLFDKGEEVQALIEQADVVHFHKIREDYVISYDFKDGVTEFDLEPMVKGKKIVYHIHGHPYERENVDENAAEYAKRGNPVLTATPDLMEMYKPKYPMTCYFPNLVPINDVRYLPRATNALTKAKDGSEWLILFQSGTNSILKNMHLIRDVMDKIGDELHMKFLHTSPEKIQPQDIVLRHKRIAHMVFDHLEGYYGLSSLEALSMGKPTIAGLDGNSIRGICEFFNVTEQDLPWVIPEKPDADSVERTIRTLAKDESLRLAIGANSRKFMEEVWSDARVAQRLAAFYEAL